ncbi:hypothetical protein TNCV_2284981 [Trichonephila clavipes]|nr:hypothetical protein TNCV_2284981 [Trichonephila clavipes]
MWCKFFQEEAPNLLKIVQFVCSVPVSNAFMERIFSVMGNVWTDERNRLAVNTLQINEQLTHRCYHFMDEDVVSTRSGGSELVDSAIESWERNLIHVKSVEVQSPPVDVQRKFGEEVPTQTTPDVTLGEWYGEYDAHHLSCLKVLTLTRFGQAMDHMTGPLKKAQWAAGCVSLVWRNDTRQNSLSSISSCYRGVVVLRGVPSQVSSSTFDRGSELRGLLPITLVLLHRASLISTQSNVSKPTINNM